MAVAEVISQVTLSSDAPSITIGSIPQTFKTLEARVVLRMDNTSFPFSTRARMAINGSSTASQYFHFGQELLWNPPSFDQGNTHETDLLLQGTSSNSTANMFGYSTMTFNNYTSTSHKKGGHFNTQAYIGTGYRQQRGLKAGWSWNQTAAITSLVLGIAGTNLKAGTTFTLIGIGT